MQQHGSQQGGQQQRAMVAGVEGFTLFTGEFYSVHGLVFNSVASSSSHALLYYGPPILGPIRETLPLCLPFPYLIHVHGEGHSHVML